MEKFTKNELNIFNLIKAGKSKSDIVTAKVTTLANLNALLSSIYRKTDEFVNYHSERNKFEELAGYLRNNPEVFGPIPAGEYKKVEAENIKAAKSKPEPPTQASNKKENTPQAVEKIVKSALEKVKNKIQDEIKITNAKAETLNEVYTEILKGGVCL